MSDLSVPVILTTGSQVYWKDHSPSTIPIQFLYFLLTHSCFNTPDPHHPHSTRPWVTWSFQFRLFFICDLLSIKVLGCTEVSLIMHLCFSDCLLSFSFIVWVRMTLPMCLSLDVCVWVRNSSLHNKNFAFSPQQKAAPLLYYTSVLISTKITTIFSLWDPYWTWLRCLTKLKDQDCLWAQHISWSLVLPPSWNHGMFASPLGAPATSQFHIGFLCGSVLNNAPNLFEAIVLKLELPDFIIKFLLFLFNIKLRNLCEWVLQDVWGICACD